MSPLKNPYGNLHNCQLRHELRHKQDLRIASTRFQILRIFPSDSNHSVTTTVTICDRPNPLPEIAPKWSPFATCFRYAAGRVVKPNFAVSVEPASALPFRRHRHCAEWLPKPCHGTRHEMASTAYQIAPLETLRNLVRMVSDSDPEAFPKPLPTELMETALEAPQSPTGRLSK